MCRELKESLLIGCLIGSTWIPKSKSNMLTPKNNLLTSQPKEVSREMSGISWCVCSTSCVFRHILVAISKVLSRTRERFVIGAISKRGQDSTSSDGSLMAKARPTSLVLQGQRKEGVSSQRSGCPVNLGNEYNKKRVGLATANRCSSSSNAEVGSSQVCRQEMVT